MPDKDTRRPQYRDGQRNALKWAITFLHEEASLMNDPHAKSVLNNAAFHMSVAAQYNPEFGPDLGPPVITGPKSACCKLCGKPLPEGEEMFLYHGYSGPCPK